MFFHKKENGWTTFGKTLAAAIAIVMIWRGTWDLLDTFLFPDNQLLSDIVSIFIGIAILYILDGGLKKLVG